MQRAISTEAAQNYARGIGVHLREDYRKAGLPYGDADEGFTRWVKELIQAKGRGNTEFGAI
jgi:hypothetical protein